MPNSNNAMRVHHLELVNFRGIKHLELLLHPQLTVIVGDNGSGKSSILDALTIALSQYVARLTKAATSAQRISDADVRMGAAETNIVISAKDGADDFRWKIVKQGQRDRVLRPTSSDYRGVSDLVKKIAARQEATEHYLEGETPVIFYNQRRAIIDIPQRKRGAVSHGVADAFSESLNPGGIDFRRLTYWFQERETEELRHQRRDRKYSDRQLDAVRRAITSATHLRDPFYRIDVPRGLAFIKGRTKLLASQLSTGERIYMALAGDLARRLAIINPDNPLRASAFVMIDEIELHLHPNWQRAAVAWLIGTFPNCQFVLTTHSPQVLSEVHAESVRVLTSERGNVGISSVRSSYGRDSNFLLASAFGAVERPSVVKEGLEKIDRALANDKLDAASAEISRLRAQVEGADPQIDIAEARLARRKASSQK